MARRWSAQGVAPGGCTRMPAESSNCCMKILWRVTDMLTLPCVQMNRAEMGHSDSNLPRQRIRCATVRQLNTSNTTAMCRMHALLVQVP